MTGRLSLVEQKRLQWAKEREEMARLNRHWEAQKPANVVHPTVRKIPSRDCQTVRKTRGDHYSSLCSLESGTSLRSLNFASMINILDGSELTARKRSPSLPPIYCKDGHKNCMSHQDLSSSHGLEVEGSRYTNHPRVQKHFDEREGETSGYASDSVDVPIPQAADVKRLVPLSNKAQNHSQMSEKTWQNPYCDTPDTSLPPTSTFSAARLGELNRPRWGSIWEQGNSTNDPPPPSWLERGLTHLDHSSQVLVINHDSASSPDSSTTESTGSESKTYLRGQNIPVDSQILQEREARRQKALELQTAIKLQLEEKERKRKQDRERQLREEREEDERIQRERDKEKKRFEEEQRKLKEKEEAKLKKEEAMKEILETAEKLAKEKKRQRRQRDETTSNQSEVPLAQETTDIDALSVTSDQRKPSDKTNPDVPCPESTFIDVKPAKNVKTPAENVKTREETSENCVRLPVNNEVAIVLTGRLEDAEFLKGSNLQVVNFVVEPGNQSRNSLETSIGTLVKTISTSPPCTRKTSQLPHLTPSIVENRLLTPSKYRARSGRDFGTQTDAENDSQDFRSIKDSKEQKEVVNNSRRDVEKIRTNTMEEKTTTRSKPHQPRKSLESRPRWNANRPGTRYRTQSEKDPHYQRRLRLRRRQVESSDERSRSPSPDLRKSTNKLKIRNGVGEKSKLDSCDDDFSMDSLNSVIPLRIDERGRINLKLRSKNVRNSCRERENEGVKHEPMGAWSEEDILYQLASLRNGLLSKQREWESERCLVSPSTEFY